jgi:hypothetical protein
MKVCNLRGAAASVFFGVVAIALGTAAVSAAPLLSVDVSSRTIVDGGVTNSGTQAGFFVFTMGAGSATQGASTSNTNGVTQAVGAYSMNLAPANVLNVTGSGVGLMDDRDRNFSLPVGATTTYTEIYDDFIFNNSNTGGLRLTVSGGDLQPSTQYTISIYAYDHSSGTVTRTANWVDGNNADALVLSTAFFGGIVPPNNDANKFTGIATTDANGVLLLNGLNTTAISPTNGFPTAQGVFLNGFEISAIPEPGAAMGLAGAAMLLIARRRR